LISPSFLTPQEKFHKLYRLFVDKEQVDSHDLLGQESISFLAEKPGWHIEVRGPYLFMFRLNRLVPKRVASIKAFMEQGEWLLASFTRNLKAATY